MHPTRELAQSPLFQCHPETLPIRDRIQLTYDRAKAIGRIYALAYEDVLTLSPKFWQMHTDPIWCIDGAASTLATIQYNLCAGTLAMFASKCPDLQAILDQVLRFEVSGQFCMTEVGHGLDAVHLETTATLLDNGEFELVTPNDNAAKYMPPTAPVGIPCIAVALVRTIIKNEDRGIKPFLVPINDGKEMCPGVVCRLLPQRGGSRPVNHSLTYFNRVRLPYSALLGSAKAPADPRAAFFSNIARVAVGTLAIGSLGLPVLQVSSYIASRYSLRRTVVDAQGVRRPIMDFQTQKIPIMTALAQSFAMQALHDFSVAIFCDTSIDFPVRHAIATITKAVMIQHAQAAALTLSDRCGAQGLFEVNQLSALHADMRGCAIAEGDTLALSIRLASELLLGRYAVPSSTNPDSLLVKHEAGLFRELRGLLTRMGHHRTTDFNETILPECLNVIQAIGHRMAYDAAVSAKVAPCLVHMYEASCVKLDSAWYAEALGLSRREQCDAERWAVDAVYPRLEEFLSLGGAAPYVSAPFVSDKGWKQYLGTLQTYGDSDVERDGTQVAYTARL